MKGARKKKKKKSRPKMSYPERQIQYVFTSVWILAVKFSVNKLQSI